MSINPIHSSNQFNSSSEFCQQRSRMTTLGDATGVRRFDWLKIIHSGKCFGIRSFVHVVSDRSRCDTWPSFQYGHPWKCNSGQWWDRRSSHPWKYNRGLACKVSANVCSDSWFRCCQHCLEVTVVSRLAWSSKADSCCSINVGATRRAALLLATERASCHRRYLGFTEVLTQFKLARISQADDGCFSINDGELAVPVMLLWLPSTLLGLHRKRPARILQADGGCISINDGERSTDYVQ